MRQRFIRYIGKEIGKPTFPATSRRVMTHNLRIMNVRRSLDVEVVDRLSRSLGINDLVPASSMVLVYSQLLDRPSINRMEESISARQTYLLKFLKLESVSTADLYNSLGELNDVDFSPIERRLSPRFS